MLAPRPGVSALPKSLDFLFDFVMARLRRECGVESISGCSFSRSFFLINSSDQQSPRPKPGGRARELAKRSFPDDFHALRSGLPSGSTNKRYVAKQADHCPLPIKTDPLPLGPDIISGHKISQDGAAAINMSDLSFKINLLSLGFLTCGLPTLCGPCHR